MTIPFSALEATLVVLFHYPGDVIVDSWREGCRARGVFMTVSQLRSGVALRYGKMTRMFRLSESTLVCGSPHAIAFNQGVSEVSANVIRTVGAM